MYILMNQSGIYLTATGNTRERDKALVFARYVEAFNARPVGFRILSVS